MPTSNYKEQIDLLNQVKDDLEDLISDLTDLDDQAANEAADEVDSALHCLEDALTILKYP